MISVKIASFEETDSCSGVAGFQYKSLLDVRPGEGFDGGRMGACAVGWGVASRRDAETSGFSSPSSASGQILHFLWASTSGSELHCSDKAGQGLFGFMSVQELEPAGGADNMVSGGQEGDGWMSPIAGRWTSPSPCHPILLDEVSWTQMEAKGY